MCGIVAFLGNRLWERPTPMDSLVRCADLLKKSSLPSEALVASTAQAVDLLEEHFAELMSFATYHTLTHDPSTANLIQCVSGGLKERLQDFDSIPEGSNIDRTKERLRDYSWQVEYEVLDKVLRTKQLLPSAVDSMPRNYLAWCAGQVLENLERLEVRGRDSAGLCIQLQLPAQWKTADCFNDAQMNQWRRRCMYDPSLETSIISERRGNASVVVGFQYKVASVSGALGDNAMELRRLIREDSLLWTVAGALERVNIVSHTRWASNGVISISNCHPLDAEVPDVALPTSADGGAVFVLNGDVDNCVPLQAAITRRIRLDERVTTDAKVPAIFFRFETSPELSLEERFAEVASACEGSMALVMQHPEAPDRLFLSRKGSGQDLFVSEVQDGWLVASEAYGVVAEARHARSLVSPDSRGVQLTISVEDDRHEFTARSLHDQAVIKLPQKKSEIFSRDIFRGEYEYFLLKELHEAPRSIEQTLRGRYRVTDDEVSFRLQGSDSFGPLLERLHSRSLPVIDDILIIGQGTASISAMSIAHFLKSALRDSPIKVSSSKSSELLSFDVARPLTSTLLIAVSQSGTTTDTNRMVDLASSRGAWVHAIVNRRESWLANNAHSRTFTSDGRDIEMSVASTKAFYSQVAAGKLLTLFLATEYKTLSPADLRTEIQELEKLPHKVREVLSMKDVFQSCAERFAAKNANWAVVGNGPNKIAAEELRIKLSELCYKSIPCDFTEDKKHIDLSTEPLTIVVANDLPESVAGDTVKEVGIFKAQGGTPIVFCSSGEKRFYKYAAECIEVPRIGGGLGFVLAAAAGHLWGFFAAMSIDDAAKTFRELRGKLTGQLEANRSQGIEDVNPLLDEIFVKISQRDMNATLLPSTVAALANFRMKCVGLVGGVRPELLKEGITALNLAIENTSRPIDSIRHQAKTVTVGISRPETSITECVREMLRHFSISLDELSHNDVLELQAISPLITAVHGGIKYGVESAALPIEDGEQSFPIVRALERFGVCVGKASHYDEASLAVGSKRKAIRTKRIVWGVDPDPQSAFAIIPITNTNFTGRLESMLVLVHMEFSPTAPLALKLEVLRRLGSRYEDMLEYAEEGGSKTFEEYVKERSPMEVIVPPVTSLPSPRNQSIVPTYKHQRV